VKVQLGLFTSMSELQKFGKSFKNVLERRKARVTRILMNYEITLRKGTITLSITTLSITILRIMTLSIMTFN
jgi:hypothetical protein